MSFLLRSARIDDVSGLFDLSRQFTLLNLPSNKKTLQEIVQNSMSSFAGEQNPNKAIYLFVAEDVESEKIVATSLIHGKCGTIDSPNYSYEVIKRDLFSRDLAIGFIHQVLRLKENFDGPTEIGGLLVDRNYRGRPEKLGRQISFIRFCFIGAFPHLFTDHLHVEFAPPLTEEGRSEFWEALGRRFTGLPYQEADALSQQNKEFIKSLFPPEDIYLTLLDARARLVLGRVAEETRAAQGMLEAIGFEYINEVDPFDGGPHYRAVTKNVLPIKNGASYKVSVNPEAKFASIGMIGFMRDGEYFGGRVAYVTQGSEIFVSEKDRKHLSLDVGEQIYLCR